MRDPNDKLTLGADNHLAKATGMRAGPTGEEGLSLKKLSQSPFERQSAAAAAMVEHLATFVTKTVQFKKRERSYSAFTKVVDSLSLLL